MPCSPDIGLHSRVRIEWDAGSRGYKGEDVGGCHVVIGLALDLRHDGVGWRHDGVEWDGMVYFEKWVWDEARLDMFDVQQKSQLQLALD